MSAFPSGVFADPVAANCWAFEQKKIAAYYRMQMTDYGNELVTRVPVANFKGQTNELVIEVNPVATLGDRMGQRMVDAQALWGWHQDARRPITIGYRRCLMSE